MTREQRIALSNAFLWHSIVEGTDPSNIKAFNDCSQIRDEYLKKAGLPSYGDLCKEAIDAQR